MTDIQDRAGAKWFAGLVLAALLMNMGNGLVLTAYAEEAGDPPPAEEPAPLVEETAPVVEEITPPEETQTSEEPEVSVEQNTGPEDGVDGEDGEPIDEESWKWYFNKIGKGNCPIKR